MLNYSEIWELDIESDEYPKRLKFHLKDQAPKTLYGVGDKALFEIAGQGIVGSRDIDDEAAEFTREYARKFKLIISGGARGTDRIATETALKAGNYSIVVLGDSLGKRSTYPFYKKYIESGNLMLLSPYEPHVDFSVFRAMGRNKIIYGLSVRTTVVSSAYYQRGHMGGGYRGIDEETTSTRGSKVRGRCPEGNKELLKLGGIPVSL